MDLIKASQIPFTLPAITAQLDQSSASNGQTNIKHPVLMFKFPLSGEAKGISIQLYCDFEDSHVSREDFRAPFIRLEESETGQKRGS